MRRKTVLITGGTGQLGFELHQLLRHDHEALAPDRQALDITDWQNVRAVVTETQPSIILHCAAATDVDRCEREPEWAFQVNAVATRYLAAAAAMVDATFVYVSTNYVFNGALDRPYHEYDEVQPISAYGRSKLAAEREAREHAPRHYIVRTSWLYSTRGRNFVSTMRRLLAELPQLTVVSDQFGNPTCATDLARSIQQILQKAPFGTYHVVNSGHASWFDWASAIAEITGMTTPILPIPGADFKRDASPPVNGRMTSLFLEDLGIEMPDWRDALQRCLSI